MRPPSLIVRGFLIGGIVHTPNKEVRVVLSTGYGDINEWGSTFLEKERTHHNTYCGKVEDTIRVTITRKLSGNISPVFRSWLGWEEGEKSFLKMKWITDKYIEIDPRKLKWYKNGEETTPGKESLRGSLHTDVVSQLRCQLAGTPGLPLLLMRHHLIAEIFSAGRMVNEPVLWVPRVDVGNPGCVAGDVKNVIEKTLTYVCSGAGSINTRLYWTVRGICIDALQATPWSLWKLSGARAELMFADLCKQNGVYKKLVKAVKDLIESPHEMLGVKYTAKKEFSKCIPWFLIDDSSSRIPETKHSWITARRVESTQRSVEGFIPSEQLGIPSWRDIVSFMPPVETPPQIPPVVSSPCPSEEKEVVASVS